MTDDNEPCQIEVPITVVLMSMPWNGGIGAMRMRDFSVWLTPEALDFHATNHWKMLRHGANLHQLQKWRGRNVKEVRALRGEK